MNVLSLAVVLSTAWASVALAAPTASGALHYTTSHGRVELIAATDAVAVQVLDAKAFEKVLAPYDKKVERQHLFGSYALLKNVPPMLTQALTQSGAARLLPAYHPAGYEVLLITDGRILARFAKGLADADIQKRVTKAGGASVRKLREGLHLVTTEPARTVEVATRLNDSHLSVWAHPDFISQRRLMHVPNDPLFDEQWHHAVIGSAGAWETTMGSDSIIIAIIDSGTDTTHPDLAGKIVSPRDTLMNDDDPTPDSTDAHGTGTSGLAAAIGDNETGVIGTCPNCSLMPIRMMSESGYGRDSADVDAFYWAADHGAQILSNSWGAAFPAPVEPAMEDAIHYVTGNARDGKGALIFFAAGNDYRENEAQELAADPLVVGVGATGYWDVKESYSNWGDSLDIASPAATVTTDIQGNAGYAEGDYTYDFGGTSAATPVTAGIAGLVLSINPDLTREEVQQILYDTADKIDERVTYTNGRTPYYGYGRVNALRAVQKASGVEVCQPQPENCTNEVDDDCDFTVDAADITCMPSEIDVGIGCTRDQECGRYGVCLNDMYGYPAGYCSTSCNDTYTCPGDGLCIPDGDSGMCVDTCSSVADCRQADGYDCLPTGIGDTKACTPSCKYLGCRPGDTCDEATGACWHDGPNPAGGACMSSPDCADNGRCLREQWFGLPGGFCDVDCMSNDDCPEATSCQNMGHFAMCVPSCQRVSDCRDGYTCWPDGSGGGMCWMPCASADDCADGETCNEWGLCGDETPPDTSVDTDPGGTPVDVCGCDITTVCDTDADGNTCSCDPECGAKKKHKKGCAAAPAGAWGALAALFTLVRRRRLR